MCSVEGYKKHCIVFTLEVVSSSHLLALVHLFVQWVCQGKRKGWKSADIFKVKKAAATREGAQWLCRVDLQSR